MADKIDLAISEIAARHGIAVGRNDPILMLLTINERLLDDSQKAQQEALDRFKEELETIAHRWGDDAKTKAERILNAALTASRDSMKKSMQEGAQLAAETMERQVIDGFSRQFGAPLREAKRIAYMNMAASLLTFLAALAVLIGWLFG